MLGDYVDQKRGNDHQAKCHNSKHYQREEVVKPTCLFPYYTAKYDAQHEQTSHQTDQENSYFLGPADEVNLLVNKTHC